MTSTGGANGQFIVDDYHSDDLGGMDKLAISVWAKRNNLNEDARIIFRPGAYELRLYAATSNLDINAIFSNGTQTGMQIKQHYPRYKLASLCVDL